MIIIPANTLSTGGYDVANSCRFNDGSSDYLNRTPGSAGNLRTYTISFWVKRSSLGQMWMFQQGADNGTDTTYLTFTSTDELDFNDYDGTENIALKTNRKFRDFSAWYHIVIAVDTTQGTASNRVKMYINGVQETSFATETYPSQNFDTELNGTDLLTLCRRVDDGGSPGLYYDGYLAEVVMIDGTQLDPTSFGEFDEDSGIWKPIDVSELTFGTNGFYLDFEDSAALGNDVSGNNNDFTVNNLTAIDQSTDTCTNNFAVFNGLLNSNGTLTEGNLKFVTSNSSSNYGYRNSSIGVSAGRWYTEIKYTSSSNQALIGIRGRNNIENVVHYIGYYNDGWGLYINGKYYHNAVGGASVQNYGVSWTNGDIIGIYLDCEDNKLYFSKNGAIMNSGTGISITDPNSVTDNVYYFSVTEWNSTGNGTFEANFGTPSFSISSGNTDDNGYGNFEYSPNITGDGSAKSFYALNTKNLAEYGG